LASELFNLLEYGRVIASGSVAEMKDDPRIIEAYLGVSHG
jgi:branched-chain amino acid transport system ATP-binding protein